MRSTAEVQLRVNKTNRIDGQIAYEATNFASATNVNLDVDMATDFAIWNRYKATDFALHIEQNGSEATDFATYNVMDSTSRLSVSFL